MRINYLCPKCDAFLRVGDSVIFYVISSQTSRKGLILLHADLGNYSVTNHPNISFNKGDYVEFFCPVCHANLAASTTNNNLVRIKMVDEETSEVSYVYFSKVAGEKSTFRIQDNQVIEQYGDDAYLYVDFFNLAQFV